MKLPECWVPCRDVGLAPLEAWQWVAPIMELCTRVLIGLTWMRFLRPQYRLGQEDDKSSEMLSGEERAEGWRGATDCLLGDG